MVVMCFHHEALLICDAIVEGALLTFTLFLKILEVLFVSL